MRTPCNQQFLVLEELGELLAPELAGYTNRPPFQPSYPKDLETIQVFALNELLGVLGVRGIGQQVFRHEKFAASPRLVPRIQVLVRYRSKAIADVTEVAQGRVACEVKLLFPLELRAENPLAPSALGEGGEALNVHLPQPRIHDFEALHPMPLWRGALPDRVNQVVHLSFGEEFDPRSEGEAFDGGFLQELLSGEVGVGFRLVGIGDDETVASPLGQ